MSQRRCPRDGTILVEKKRDPLVYLFCPGCRGLWLSRGDFRQLRDLTVDPSWRPLLPETGLFTRRPRIIEGAARCVCAETPVMQAIDKEGLVVDVCPSCSGIWLDGGEIQQIYSIYRPQQIDYPDVAFALLQQIGLGLFPWKK